MAEDKPADDAADKPADDAGKEEKADDSAADDKADDKPADDEGAEDAPPPKPKKKVNLIAEARKVKEELEILTKEFQETVKEAQDAAAEYMLQGKAPAGGSPIKETDEEYAEKIARGEADPLADDGFKTQ